MPHKYIFFFESFGSDIELLHMHAPTQMKKQQFWKHKKNMQSPTNAGSHPEFHYALAGSRRKS